MDFIIIHTITILITTLNREKDNRLGPNKGSRSKKPSNTDYQRKAALIYFYNKTMIFNSPGNRQGAFKNPTLPISFF